jgi:uncharacterized protein (TIGR00251 family)
LTTEPPALSIDADSSGVGFWIHVTPRAKKPGVAGIHGDALRVAVSAPPLEGKANAACVAAIAEALACRRGDIALDPASRGRRKRVRVDGDPAALRERLSTLAQSPRVG